MPSGSAGDGLPGRKGARVLPMFAGIFAIGSFFAMLFWRSGNLWMVAIFHGIGNFYIEGTVQQ